LSLSRPKTDGWYCEMEDCVKVWKPSVLCHRPDPKVASTGVAEFLSVVIESTSGKVNLVAVNVGGNVVPMSVLSKTPLLVPRNTVPLEPPPPVDDVTTVPLGRLVF
jgi:hypothetical protein